MTQGGLQDGSRGSSPTAWRGGGSPVLPLHVWHWMGLEGHLLGEPEG